MGVVQRNQTQTQGNADSKDKLPEVDLEKILAMPSGTGLKRALDPTEDAWERSAPVEPGRYTIKAFLSKEKVKMGYYDEAKKEPWFTLNLECKIQSDDPDINNTTVFGGVSTRINARKKISTAAGLIAKYGFKLPAEASDIDIVKLLKAALAKEKTIDVEIDWKAGYKEADGSWINLANTYEDFPDNPEGGKDYVIKATKKDNSKEEVRARLNITHWYGKDEKEVKGGNTGAKVNGGVPVLAEDEPNNVVGLTPKPKEKEPTKASPAPRANPVNDEDALAALLGEG